MILHVEQQLLDPVELHCPDCASTELNPHSADPTGMFRCANCSWTGEYTDAFITLIDLDHHLTHDHATGNPPTTAP
jgi:hypothetical protein